MSCKGICPRYKASKPIGIGRYANGQKRCQICEIFINYAGLWCPCCGYRLRSTPRNIKYKTKLREARANGLTKTFGIIPELKIKGTLLDSAMNAGTLR